MNESTNEMNMIMGNNALANTNNNYNVVGFTNNSIMESINLHLDTYDSNKTKQRYLSVYREMFMHICGKQLELLTVEDVCSITFKKVKVYRSYLKKKYNQIKTVNEDISICKKLWGAFIEDDEDEVIKNNPFVLDKLKIKDKDNHYGSLTEEELDGLYKFCLAQKSKPSTKKLYFEFLATVTCRKSVTQELKFDDIKRTLNRKTGTYYWVIKDVYDKTEFVDTAISDEFYNRLMDNFNSYDWVDQKKGYIFNLSDSTLNNVLIDYCKFADIDKEGRNIVQHSIKSTGLDRIQEVFEDINITARAGGHKSIQTTYDNYIGKNVDYSQQPSILLSKNYNIDMLKGLSQEELVNIIMGCGKNTIIKACIKAEEKGLINIR